SGWPLGSVNSCDTPRASQRISVALSTTVVGAMGCCPFGSTRDGGYLLSEYRSSATWYNRRQTMRLNNTTTAAMTSTLAANSGMSTGAGTDAAPCAPGCSTRDSRGDRPMASPAGSAHTVPSAVEISTLSSVTPAADTVLPQVSAGTWSNSPASLQAP